MEDASKRVSSASTERMDPLHFAVNQGHLEIIELLLEHGAAVNVKSNVATSNYCVIITAATGITVVSHCMQWEENSMGQIHGPCTDYIQK